MKKRTSQKEQEAVEVLPESELTAEQNTMPSAAMITALYGAGAIVALICAFSPTLGPLQATNCLLISWVLGLGALAVNFLCEERPDEDLF